MSDALENEIANDPDGKGYSGMTDAQLADSLNAVTISRDRKRISGRDLKAYSDVDEFNLLPGAKQQQFLTLTRRDDLDLSGMDMDIMVSIFGSLSKTVAKLETEKTETVSKAMMLGLRTVTEGYLRSHTLSRKETSDQSPAVELDVSASDVVEIQRVGEDSFFEVHVDNYRVGTGVDEESAIADATKHGAYAIEKAKGRE
jgi:hypothetical protein